ncbi:hydroxyquinol 1,2-dioxygenase [Terfezia claveryi]|nr:hydroxyquinol 1,2-dioxygenase [Terfezia claveryi]
MTDLNPTTITAHAIQLNSSSPNPRLNSLLTSLISHLHSFTRETNLTSDEWQAGIDFLTRTGQSCTLTRQEFILLSDILGLSTLITTLNYPTLPLATEPTVLGPFHTHDAPSISLGDSISSPSKAGEPCLFRCSVRTLSGSPIPGAKIDVWETDGSGRYDTQYEPRRELDCRGVLTSNEQGRFWFKCVKPVSYSIPVDGPVGELLNALGRHPFRPAHIHFLITAEGYKTLVTALYVRGDPYEMSDAVFGVKRSLVVDFERVQDEEVLREFGLEKGAWGVQYDFVLVGEKEAEALRRAKVEEEDKRREELVEGLQKLDVD